MGVLELSEYILRYCTKIGKPITHLQLQMMLFFMQIFSLINRKCFLIREPFKALLPCPIIIKVYYQYNIYGGNKIARYDDRKEYNFNHHIEDDIELANFIAYLVDRDTNSDLRRILNQKDSPYCKVYNNGKGYGEVISNELLIDYANSRIY